MARKADIFSALYRWAHRQDENFTTEAFVYLLNHLLGHERACGEALVRLLCFPEDPTSHVGGRIHEITTQWVTEEGTPDIRIESDALVAFIEVKKGSGLARDQLGRYRRILAKQAEGRATRLGLLTVYPMGVQEDEERPDSHARWDQVADLLGKLELSQELSKYLVDEFLSFLRGQVMTVQRVSWEYMAGTKALCDLTNMIGKAVEGARIPIHQCSGAWGYRGYYLDGKKYWVGVYLETPQQIVFETVESRVDAAKVKELGRAEVREDGKCVIRLDLDSEPVHFFARSKESQLECLTGFVGGAYRDMERCLINA